MNSYPDSPVSLTSSNTNIPACGAETRMLGTPLSPATNRSRRTSQNSRRRRSTSMPTRRPASNERVAGARRRAVRARPLVAERNRAPAEIAAALGTTESSIRSRIFRARKELAVLLEKEGIPR